MGEKLKGDYGYDEGGEIIGGAQPANSGEVRGDYGTDEPGEFAAPQPTSAGGEDAPEQPDPDTVDDDATEAPDGGVGPDDSSVETGDGLREEFNLDDVAPLAFGVAGFTRETTAREEGRETGRQYDAETREKAGRGEVSNGVFRALTRSVRVAWRQSRGKVDMSAVEERMSAVASRAIHAEEYGAGHGETVRTVESTEEALAVPRAYMKSITADMLAAGTPEARQKLLDDAKDTIKEWEENNIFELADGQQAVFSAEEYLGAIKKISESEAAKEAGIQAVNAQIDERFRMTVVENAQLGTGDLQAEQAARMGAAEKVIAAGGAVVGAGAFGALMTEKAAKLGAIRGLRAAAAVVGGAVGVGVVGGVVGYRRGAKSAAERIANEERDQFEQEGTIADRLAQLKTELEHVYQGVPSDEVYAKYGRITRQDQLFGWQLKPEVASGLGRDELKKLEGLRKQYDRLKMVEARGYNAESGVELTTKLAELLNGESLRSPEQKAEALTQAAEAMYLDQLMRGTAEGHEGEFYTVLTFGARDARGGNPEARRNAFLAQLSAVKQALKAEGVTDEELVAKVKNVAGGLDEKHRLTEAVTAQKEAIKAAGRKGAVIGAVSGGLLGAGVFTTLSWEGIQDVPGKVGGLDWDDLDGNGLNDLYDKTSGEVILSDAQFDPVTGNLAAENMDALQATGAKVEVTDAGWDYTGVEQHDTLAGYMDKFPDATTEVTERTPVGNASTRIGGWHLVGEDIDLGNGVTETQYYYVADVVSTDPNVNVNDLQFAMAASEDTAGEVFMADIDNGQVKIPADTIEGRSLFEKTNDVFGEKVEFKGAAGQVVSMNESSATVYDTVRGSGVAIDQDVTYTSGQQVKNFTVTTQDGRQYNFQTPKLTNGAGEVSPAVEGAADANVVNNVRMVAMQDGAGNAVDIDVPAQPEVYDIEASASHSPAKVGAYDWGGSLYTEGQSDEVALERVFNSWNSDPEQMEFLNRIENTPEEIADRAQGGTIRQAVVEHYEYTVGEFNDQVMPQPINGGHSHVVFVDTADGRDALDTPALRSEYNIPEGARGRFAIRQDCGGQVVWISEDTTPEIFEDTTETTTTTPPPTTTTTTVPEPEPDEPTPTPEPEKPTPTPEPEQPTPEPEKPTPEPEEPETPPETPPRTPKTDETVAAREDIREINEPPREYIETPAEDGTPVDTVADASNPEVGRGNTGDVAEPTVPTPGQVGTEPNPESRTGVDNDMTDEDLAGAFSNGK